MTRPIRLTVLALFVAAAVAAATAPRLLPPPAAVTPAPHWPLAGLTVRGAYHIHSTRSDGTGSVDEIAAEAARAGLQFVILTDHGDAMRAPDPPRYRSGVLCIDAVEINTTGGHLVALGISPAPYPLAGSPSAVVEDVHRLGGMAIAAHPGSPRTSLQWTEWAAPLDGLEWLNADNEWRDELIGSLGRLLLTGMLRQPETLASILDRPDAALTRWDQETQRAPMVGLAGADAHARLGFRQQSEPYQGWHVRVPSYEASFRAFGIRVLVDAPLTGDPGRDANEIVARIRAGRTYTVIDGLATPGAFDFTAASGGAAARMGEYLEIAGEVILHARMAAPPGTRMVILRDGAALFDTQDRETHVGVATDPAVYRVELRAPGAAGEPPIPWLVSNPIYVGMRGAHVRGRPQQTVAPARTRVSIAVEAWRAEASSASASELRPRVLTADGVAAVEWRYRLAGGEASGQYAAVVFPVESLAGRDRLQLRARADRPMRVSIQLRAPGRGTAGERWGRTIYLDDSYRDLDVLFADLESLGETSTPKAPLDRIDALLLVVDTLNTKPGVGGRIDLAELWLARP